MHAQFIEGMATGVAVGMLAIEAARSAIDRIYAPKQRKYVSPLPHPSMGQKSVPLRRVK